MFVHMFHFGTAEQIQMKLGNEGINWKLLVEF